MPAGREGMAMPIPADEGQAAREEETSGKRARSRRSALAQRPVSSTTGALLRGLALAPPRGDA